MRILVDCRYIRFPRHDGISRYTANLVAALAPLAREAGHELVMVISDEGQLTMLPELPWQLATAPTSPRELTIARRLNAKGLNFYAPLVLSTEGLAKDLRNEPVIREQLAGISECDLALYSIGTVDAGSHVVKCGALTSDEMDALRREGAAGVVAGQIIDNKGALLDCSYNRRCISADLASLRAIPKRLVVVQEENKFEPLLAGLAGGLCTHLVINAAMARRLLDHAKAANRRKAS